MKVFEYLSNNSGGGWWLKEKDWKALEKAGWKVKWGNGQFFYTNEGEYTFDKDGFPQFENNNELWLGAPAKYAFLKAKDIDEAIKSFEEATGQNYEDEGCNCCGKPHSISEV